MISNIRQTNVRLAKLHKEPDPETDAPVTTSLALKSSPRKGSHTKTSRRGAPLGRRRAGVGVVVVFRPRVGVVDVELDLRLRFFDFVHRAIIRTLREREDRLAMVFATASHLRAELSLGACEEELRRRMLGSDATPTRGRMRHVEAIIDSDHSCQIVTLTPS